MKQLSGHFPTPEWSLFSAGAPTYLLYLRCDLLDLNPGYLLAMEAYQCDYPERIVALFSQHVAEHCPVGG